MNDEIKEILEHLKYRCAGPKELELSDCLLLLDYITTLQQKYDEANNAINWWSNKAKELQQENERLKKPDYHEKGLIGSIKERDDIITQLTNNWNELEECVESRLMSIPDDMFDDKVEEAKRTTKIAVYQVILGKMKEIKGKNDNI